MACAGALNVSHYRNPEVDALIDRARPMAPGDARTALLQRLDRILHEDCPMVWLANREQALVHQPYVRGVRIHPMRLDLREVWLDLPRRPAASY